MDKLEKKFIEKKLELEKLLEEKEKNINFFKSSNIVPILEWFVNNRVQLHDTEINNVSFTKSLREYGLRKINNEGFLDDYLPITNVESYVSGKYGYIFGGICISHSNDRYDIWFSRKIEINESTLAYVIDVKNQFIVMKSERVLLNTDIKKSKELIDPVYIDQEKIRSLSLTFYSSHSNWIEEIKTIYSIVIDEFNFLNKNESKELKNKIESIEKKIFRIKSRYDSGFGIGNAYNLEDD